MRKSLRLVQLTLTIFLFTIFFTNQVKAQCTVTSSNGYTVNVSIIPQSIVVSNTDCPWGYNYNVTFSYNISITGPNAASAAINTLQTLIYCVNGQINGYYSLPTGGGSGTATTGTNPSVPHNGSAYGYNSPYVPCTAATVATMNCTSVDVIIAGNGIPSQTIHCNPPSPAPPINLPVEFLSFDGERTDSGNLLTWAVQSQHRNDYFMLETSTDGTNWSELTRLKGEISSTEVKAYQFLDTKNSQQ